LSCRVNVSSTLPQRNDGSRLKSFRWGNVEETFTLQLNAACQDSAIEFTQTLRRLLVKAKNYWVTKWQDTPVYIECRAPDETNTRYAIIQTGSLDNDNNYFAQPFTSVDWVGNVVAVELPLMIERTHWLGSVPGTATSQQLNGYDTFFYDQGYEIEAGPSSFVYAMIVTSGGFLIASDTSQVWRTNTGLAGSWVAHDFAGGDWDNDPGRVYAFCEDSAGDIYAACANGIFRSQDNGDNWVRRTAARNAAGRNSIIFGSDGNYYLVDNGDGLYVSADGAVWVLEYDNVEVNCIFEDSAGQLLCGMAGFINSKWSWIASNTGSGWVLKSYYGRQVTCAVSGFYEDEANPSSGVYCGSDNALLRADAGSSDFVRVGPEYTGLLDAMLVNGRYYIARGSLATTVDMTSWQIASPPSVHSVANFAGKLFFGCNGDIYSREQDSYELGRSDTTEKLYVANYEFQDTNINHVVMDDGGALTELYPMGAGPTSFLPAVPAQNDACYFGIEGLTAN